MRLHGPLLICVSLLFVAKRPAVVQAQKSRPYTLADLTWSTEAAEPQRFLAVHGRRALVMGYPSLGLEVWAYPLQLVSGYQLSFRPEGTLHSLAGNDLLRRIEYRPDEVIRTYVGADFTVRETIFVPLDKPGAIFTYEVQGRRDLTIGVQFVPSMNLMWPGALGGQDVRWDPAIPGYVISAPPHQFSATVTSPETVGFQAVVNRTIQTSESETLEIRPRLTGSGTRIASVVIGYDEAGAPTAGTARDLEVNADTLMTAASAHYRSLLDSSLLMETPDPEVNRALAWTTIALDQAWVCNLSLGCGEVAGYGPSRRGRRPQYAWYFAGDGLIAVDAWVAAGAFDRARGELRFILKYQNPQNGMIWHEISQGIELAEWKRTYPYMYVHVDITFQFLAAAARYIHASGDLEFLRQNANSIEAAYRYCQSVIEADTALPRIPPGREGSNEQDQMRDDVALSSEWIAAAGAMAQMAHLLGDDAQARQASQAAEAARRSVAERDWSPSDHFWLAGHTASGEPMHSLRPHPALLNQHIFTAEQAHEALNQLTSPDFQTDWGVRNLSASSAEYDPNGYGKGSVSALGTASLAEGLWDQHWSVPALQLWQSLIPWNTLDAEGHTHELLAGDLYHPEIESVPEQTWSSAGLLEATVRGLFGLDVDGADRRLTFAPHRVPGWHEVELRNLHVAGSLVSAHLTYQQNSVELKLENVGDPISLRFSPELPLGADVTRAITWDEQSRPHRGAVTTERSPGEEHATVLLRVPKGHTRCQIAFRGGVQVVVPTSAPAIGSRSEKLRVGNVALRDRTLSMEVYVSNSEKSTFTLQTDWKPRSLQGARLEANGPGAYVVHVEAPTADERKSPTGFVWRKVSVDFERR